jgi:transglutaminase-like putative cysteine protease
VLAYTLAIALGFIALERLQLALFSAPGTARLLQSIGWLDADPTNDQVPPRRHITVGWGRDYADVPPVRGVVIGPSSWQTLVVGVDVATV